MKCNVHWLVNKQLQLHTQIFSWPVLLTFSCYTRTSVDLTVLLTLAYLPFLPSLLNNTSNTWTHLGTTTTCLLFFNYIPHFVAQFMIIKGHGDKVDTLIGVWGERGGEKRISLWVEERLPWCRRETRQDRKMNSFIGRGKVKGWRKHIMVKITAMEGWRTEQEESSRDHNLQGRNGPWTTMELNSPVLHHIEFS